MRVFKDLEELRSMVGSEIGTSDWLPVDQERIDLFADATGDHQWIHVDVDRATAGPFGAPIAHGYLTLSLLVPMMAQVYRVDGMRMGVNYGLDRVRFVSPVPAGSRVRARATLREIKEVAPDTHQLHWSVHIERQGAEKPACIAEPITRIYTAD